MCSLPRRRARTALIRAADTAQDAITPTRQADTADLLFERDVLGVEVVARRRGDGKVVLLRGWLLAGRRFWTEGWSGAWS